MLPIAIGVLPSETGRANEIAFGGRTWVQLNTEKTWDLVFEHEPRRKNEVAFGFAIKWRDAAEQSLTPLGLLTAYAGKWKHEIVELVSIVRRRCSLIPRISSCDWIAIGIEECRKTAFKILSLGAVLVLAIEVARVICGKHDRRKNDRRRVLDAKRFGFYDQAGGTKGIDDLNLCGNCLMFAMRWRQHGGTSGEGLARR